MQKMTLPLAAACALLAACTAAAQTPLPAAAAKAPVASAARRPPLEAIPDEIFDRELKDLDGQSLFLSNFRGQVFVLNIWATWCGPCRREIPELNKLHEEFSPRGVGFVGLTIEDPEADAGKVLVFVSHLKMRYPVGWVDRETALTLFDGRGNIPQTFIVAPDGRILKRFVGFSPARSPSLMREAVRRALGDIE